MLVYIDEITYEVINLYNFIFHLPTKVIFGRGVNAGIGDALAKAGISRVLLLYGGNSVHQTGVYSDIAGSLSEKGISFVECPGVKPNPVISKTREAIEMVKANELEAIVAIGGGSVIDSAKAVAGGALYDGDVWDFFLRKAKVETAIPIYAIVTVSATASEMNFTSVQTNEEYGTKMGLHSAHFFPKISFIDPSIQDAVSEKQTVYGGIDAISHVLEAYFSADEGLEIQQEYIEGLVRSMMKLIPALRKNPADYNARSQYAWATACSLNGMAFAGYPTRGDFASHAFGHILSAKLDAVHGATLAVMMPAWMTYVYKENPGLFARFARNVFGISCGNEEEQALAGIKALRGYFAEVGAPVTLRELDVREEEIPVYSEAVTRGGPIGVFKAIHYDDALEIFKLAY